MQLSPVCFMVMPFGRKRTGLAAGAVEEVDFDVLWEKAFRPALGDLGYTPVRADQDVGPLIIREMLERLALADLVVADLTLPNGNVYYEVGVRHAARNHRCVLIAADWARPLFDLDQLRQLRYPLPQGTPSDDQAAVIRRFLAAEIPARSHAPSPLHAIEGWPEPDVRRASSFADLMTRLSDLQTEISAARLACGDDRIHRATDLLQRHATPNAPMLRAVALELLYLARDCMGWGAVQEFVEALPQDLRRLPVVEEQYQLARSKTGSHVDAIAALERLVRDHGDSSERQGLLGGRYKKLHGEKQNPIYLEKAIQHYERGLALDLNDYYPSSNLPRLYRQRKKPGDEDRAHSVAQVVVHACERARSRNAADEWLRPTLLGAAFDAGDVTKAEELAADIEREGVAKWKLETTLDDLDRSVALAHEPGTRAKLAEIARRLRDLASRAGER